MACSDNAARFSLIIVMHTTRSRFSIDDIVGYNNRINDYEASRLRAQAQDARTRTPLSQHS